MGNQQDVLRRGQGPAGGERVETVIVGGGQAGLAVGYHLARRDRPFVILDADQRTGDAWRRRWDSLRLFTPARYSGLPGLPFPGAGLVVPRPGTRSPTTWRPTPPGSSSPCATASGWTGSPGRVAASW